MAHETHGIISECAIAAAACLDQFVSNVDLLFEHSGNVFCELRPTDHLPSASGSEANATPRLLLGMVAALDPAFRAMGFLDDAGRPMGMDYTGLWLKGHTITVDEEWRQVAIKLRQIGLAAADRYQGCRNLEQPDSMYLMTIPGDTRRWAGMATAALKAIASELVSASGSLPVKPQGWTKLELTQHATISDSTFKRIADAAKLGTRADTGEHGFKYSAAQLRALIATASRMDGKPKWKQAAERWPSLLREDVAR